MWTERRFRSTAFRYPLASNGFLALRRSGLCWTAVTTTLAVEAQDGGLWRLVDRGAVREVVVEDERARHIRLLAGTGKAAEANLVVKAPMPGLVLRILVAVGDQVGAGMPLLALEAMKMENELKAADPGVVLAILTEPGKAVEKGQPLLQLGPLPH